MDCIPLTQTAQFHITLPENAKINKVKKGIDIMKKYLCIYVGFFLLINLVGCGTKGGLYMPDHPEVKYPGEYNKNKKNPT
ncbi:hypothetical protein FIT63_06370 [Candidatus Methylopumilus planktonicus]|nr:hypothetical protein FIT64_06370 [Candidatus Methylopumilus planktonicus]QDD23901.1 hypothetical protein FIT63_06370 [Candidatus Methylopumilus planktonicus]